MINPDKLTVKSAEALNEALAEARRNGNPQVYDTHLLNVLLAQDALESRQQFDVTFVDRLAKALEVLPKQARTPEQRTPVGV